MVTPTPIEVCNFRFWFKGIFCSQVFLNFRREMVSGSWGSGLVLSIDAHLYGISSVFGSFGLQRVELKNSLEL